MCVDAVRRVAMLKLDMANRYGLDADDVLTEAEKAVLSAVCHAVDNGGIEMLKTLMPSYDSEKWRNTQ